MPKLIILRGNSGSGKSSVAKAIQEQVRPYPVLIEHDYIRRKVLKEKEVPESLNAGLIYGMIQYAFENHRDVIFEGILRLDKYRPLFDKLIAAHPTENYFYYFNIPFEETLNRHATKEGVDFEVSDMQRWYKENEETGYEGEVIIPVSNSFQETVAQIIKETELLPMTE